MRTKPTPGTRVRMTGEFLRITGQQRGAEGLSQWTVRECSCGLCKLGRHVAVDECQRANPALDPDASWRHICFGNLEKLRTSKGGAV